ncbi:MAG: biotin--[acetyl-CoA-carboxylase] ligase [Legionellaceae bacterium]
MCASLAMNTTLLGLTSVLNDLAYHDGTSLGLELGITRSAVWKNIKKLVSYGIEVESLKGKGYRLTKPLYLLSADRIKGYLKTIEPVIHVLEKTTSTNDYLKTIKNEEHAWQVCIAETQTQGKGRWRRAWHSPFGQNIYLSLSYPIDQAVSALSGLSLVVALAAVSALESFYHLSSPLQIKWPNDVVFDQKKLGGNLIELQAESYGAYHVILGLGLNINMACADPEVVDQAWTSFYALTGHIQDRNPLCAHLIDTLAVYLERFSRHGLSDFMVEWRRRDSLYDQSIEVHSNQKSWSGLACGINEQGHLKVKNSAGLIELFASGDTSLRRKDV